MALKIEKREQDAKCLIAVRGEVDLYSSPELRGAILKSIPKGKGALGIDLSCVSYMDSSGVATLVEGLKSAKEKGSSFALVAPSTSVMKVLQLARLNTVFDIRDTL
jgi:anti-sigma B factor antagonist